MKELNNFQAKNNENNLSILKWIIFAVVFIGVGFLAGFLLFSGKGANKQSSSEMKIGGQPNTFQAGWEAAEKRLIEAGYLLPDSGEAKEISGEAKEITGSIIQLETQPLNPLDDPKLDTRTIKLDKNTKIFKEKTKNQEQLQEELKVFNDDQVTDDAEKAMAPPDFFLKEAANLNEIEKGQYLLIKSDKNIKNDQTIIATEIIIQEDAELEESESLPSESSSPENEALELPEDAVQEKDASLIDAESESINEDNGFDATEMNEPSESEEETEEDMEGDDELPL